MSERAMKPTNPSQPEIKPPSSGRNFKSLRVSRKPGLAVDTSFAHHRSDTPKQVFPYETETREFDFVTVNDTQALNKPRNKSCMQQPRHNRLQNLGVYPHGHAADVSPSDRAIPIGVAISSGFGLAIPKRQPFHKYEHEVVTPTIVITPAKDEFDLSASPEQLKFEFQNEKSIKWATDSPSCGHVPQVPPLPLSAMKPTLRTANVRHRCPAPLKIGEIFTSHTVIEEDDNYTPRQLPQGPMRRTSQLTPSNSRRSKGWWNVITSPFSASSKSAAFFWRSPPLQQGHENKEIPFLGSSDHLTSNIHDLLNCITPSDPDDELQSAPGDCSLASVLKRSVPEPRRSNTAPGALDANIDFVNIYRVPSQGLATAYYDLNRHFPSLIGPSTDRGIDFPEGWSPSQSVYRESKACGVSVIGNGDEETDFDNGDARSDSSTDEKCSFDDAREAEAHDFTGTRSAAGRPTFSISTKSEMRGETPGLPAPVRSDTAGTEFTHYSTTPVVEDAHIATVMAPHSSFGEPRRMDSISTGLPTNGLGQVTMSTRAIETEDDTMPMRVAETPFHHVRNGSDGLGITTVEKEMPSIPASQRYKPELPRLETDRFGQLRVATEEDKAPGRPWYQRFLWTFLAGGATLLLTLIVLLVIFVPQKHSDMPVEAQWLNLTGFPPLPTGVTTVVQPKAVHEVNGCVSPQSLWSCDVPAEQQASSDLPNFRFEVRFQNHTGSNNTALEPAHSSLSKRSGFAVRASALVKRSPWTEYLFSSSPSPPSTADRLFLGKTTDNVSAPYDGEETPFFISLLNASALVVPSHIALRKRDGNDDENKPSSWSYPYPTNSGSPGNTENPGSSGDFRNASTKATTSIPRPAVGSNGDLASAELYPFAYAQPLRLFNRDQDTEHYGFYTYFDRSLYVSNTSSSSGTSPSSAAIGNGTIIGNVPRSNATATCTWSQTRLRVQIWTRRGGSILSHNPIPSNSTGKIIASNSTANDLTAPGSFPYAITITLDRHGGEANRKGVYCYGVDSETDQVMENVKTWVAEDRPFGEGAVLVNAAQVPGAGNATTVTAAAVARRMKRDDYTQTGGIDGGSGGCACQWQNWG